jgi:hypothetical protein
MNPCFVHSSSYFHAYEWIFMGFWIGFWIYWPLYETQLVITLNYSAIAVIRTWQITRCLFQPALSPLDISLQRLLTTAIPLLPCSSSLRAAAPFQLNYSSESELLYDWRFIANLFISATSPMRVTTRIFIFQLNTWSHSPYVTFSLTREWVGRLQLLRGLISAVILRSKSGGTHDNIIQFQIRDSPNLEAQIPVFIFPMNREARLYSQALGSLFVASDDSQGYDGGSRPHLHSGMNYSLFSCPPFNPFARTE